MTKNNEPRSYRTASGIRWIAQVRVKGFAPASQSFGSRKLAAEWIDKQTRELRRLRDRGAVRHDVAKLTIGQLLAEYLDDPEVKALRTFDSVQRLADWWVSKYAGERVLSFNVLTLRRAREVLHKGRSPGTVNRYLSAMRGAWNWGRSAGLVPQDLLWPSRLMLTEPRGRVRYLTDVELGRLLKAAEADSVMRVCILVSLATGVRQGELLRLKWADIDLKGAKLTVLQSKTNTARRVHLPASAVAALESLKMAKVSSPVYPFLNDHGKPLAKSWLESKWSRSRSAAGLKDFRWHDLRHTTASYLAQSGASLPEIGSVLGHRSPSVTQRYSHLVEGAPVRGHTELDAKLKR